MIPIDQGGGGRGVLKGKLELKTETIFSTTPETSEKYFRQKSTASAWSLCALTKLARQ
jgi:hypothetical protein